MVSENKIILLASFVIIILIFAVTVFFIVADAKKSHGITITCPDEEIDPFTGRPYRALEVKDSNGRVVYDIVCNGNSNQDGNVYLGNNMVFVDRATKKQHWIGSLATLKPSISDNIHCMAWMHPNRTIEYIVGDCPEDELTKNMLGVRP